MTETTSRLPTRGIPPPELEVSAIDASSSRRPLPERLSPAALDAYLQCPQRYAYRYIEQRPPVPPGPEAALGRAVHHALERFYGLRPENRSVTKLHSSLRSVWRRHVSPELFADRFEEAAWGRQALDMLTTFVVSFDTTGVPVRREGWVTSRISASARLVGRVDRVDVLPSGGLSVIDYKTGTFALDAEQLDAEPAALIYAVATQETFRMPVERVRFLYLRTGEEVRWEPEPEDIEAARDRLSGWVARLQADKRYEPTPGAACWPCRLRDMCRASTATPSRQPSPAADGSDSSTLIVAGA